MNRPVRMGVLLALAATATPQALPGQLHPSHVVQRALAHSADVRAAAAAVAAAAGRERQASVLQNPVLSYGREQTSRGVQENAQGILQVEQGIELGRPRGSRVRAARARREAAEADLAATRARVALDAILAFIDAVAATQRARAMASAGTTYEAARRVSEERLAAGDISGYAARRLRLEVARHAADQSSADEGQRVAALRLVLLLGLPPGVADTLTLPDSVAVTAPADADADPDSLVARAERGRWEVRAAERAATAALEDAATAGRERTPTLTLSAGYKGERVADPVAGSVSGFRGLVAGVSLPFPLLDRRQGALAALEAQSQGEAARVTGVRRAVGQDAMLAQAAWASAVARRRALEGQLGEDARAALRAVQTAYAEGELTLVEWLDAQRAYREAELVLLDVRAEVGRQAARLVFAIGESLDHRIAESREDQ